MCVSFLLINPKKYFRCFIFNVVATNFYFIVWIFSGSGCSTALIRIFAALGMATELKTMTSDACKIGLARAVDTGRPVVECLFEAGNENLERLPKDHYLNKDKYF